MQTVLDANFHLDRIVTIGRHAERMHPNIFLLRDVGHSPRNRHTNEVPKVNVIQSFYSRNTSG
jgi:hypothetical protein